MKLTLRRFIRHILFMILGAGAGFLLYRYVGCPTGTCAITSNPVSSMAYMAFLGLLISSSFSRGCDGCNT